MPIIAPLTIIIGIQFALLHALAEYFELYWYFAWLDLPMHIFGGLLAVLMVYTLVAIRVLPQRIAEGSYFIGAMVVVLVLWEIFGILKYGGFKPGYVVDTTLDLLCGVLGIALGMIVGNALLRLGK